MFHPNPKYQYWIAQNFSGCILNILLQLYKSFQLKAKNLSTTDSLLTITREVEMFGFTVCSELWSYLYQQCKKRPTDTTGLHISENWRCKVIDSLVLIWRATNHLWLDFQCLFGTEFGVTAGEVAQGPSTNGAISRWLLHWCRHCMVHRAWSYHLLVGVTVVTCKLFDREI